MEEIKEQKVDLKTHKKALETAKKAASTLNTEVRDKTITAIITAFALVIALAWQDVIKETVNRIIENLNLTATELVKMTILYKSITAMIITLVAVIGIIIVSKLSKNNQNENK